MCHAGGGRTGRVPAGLPMAWSETSQVILSARQADSRPEPSGTLEAAVGAGRFREAFMRHVGGRHASLAAAAARVIAGFLLNRATDDDLLDEAG